MCSTSELSVRYTAICFEGTRTWVDFRQLVAPSSNQTLMPTSAHKSPPVGTTDACSFVCGHKSGDQYRNEISRPAPADCSLSAVTVPCYNAHHLSMRTAQSRRYGCMLSKIEYPVKRCDSRSTTSQINRTKNKITPNCIPLQWYYSTIITHETISVKHHRSAKMTIATTAIH